MKKKTRLKVKDILAEEQKLLLSAIERAYAKERSWFRMGQALRVKYRKKFRKEP